MTTITARTSLGTLMTFRRERAELERFVRFLGECGFTEIAVR